MLANYTDITILLDASGSMMSIAGETLQSLVAFIKEQQVKDGEATLTLVEFDSPGNVRYVASNQPIRSFETANLKFDPRGASTALRDAWLQVMDDRGKHFASQKESARPKQVIFVVITDGQDNASRVTKGRIKEKVTHQREKYNWVFTYLGANQDAELVAEEQGISKDFAMTYTVDNIAYAAASMSNTVAAYRETGVLRSYSTLEKMNSVDPDLKSKLTGKKSDQK